MTHTLTAGKGSKDSLLNAALGLFSEKWYGVVSVAEICRRAGVSNGLFYRYYRDKESVFKEILELVITKIADSIRAVEGKSPAERLKSFSSIIFEFSQRNQALVRVFREGQYRLFEYERRLKSVYEDGLGKAIGQAAGQTPSPAAYIFALGGLRFAAIQKAFYGIPVVFEDLAGFVEHGLFPGESFNPDTVFSTSISRAPIQLLPGSRERLLNEGKELMGRQGYHQTNIHEITSAAGLSTGAFYTYFDTKESFFGELIHHVGSDLRRFITLNLGPGLTPLERELRGLWLFIVYLSLDKTCYRLVREAEFVLPSAARSYYDAFIRGYLKQMQGSGGPDKITKIEFLLGVAHYLGMEVVFDKSPETARSIISTIGNYYVKGIFGA
ncbi:MAG TPA: TetR/AcrR family transcriptional regulator [Rectinemataceae bacterium]